MLVTVPPQFEAARAYLEANSLTHDEVTRVAIVYADQCFGDYDAYLYHAWPENCTLKDLPLPNGIIPGIPSAYIYDVVALLLPYGLDPNAVYETDGHICNIMQSILFIDNEYVAADTLRLLLDNGGKPNLWVGTETIFERIDEDIWFGSVEQEIRWRYDSWVHAWLVLLAYGGEIPGKGPMVQTFREYENYRTEELFDLKKLRDHRNYRFGLTLDNNERILHIFDKRTFWEVARA